MSFYPSPSSHRGGQSAGVSEAVLHNSGVENQSTYIGLSQKLDYLLASVTENKDSILNEIKDIKSEVHFLKSEISVLKERNEAAKSTSKSVRKKVPNDLSVSFIVVVLSMST